MNQKDKELLLKDLCGRLPYRVKLKVGNSALTLDTFYFDEGLYKTIDKVITAGHKTYLRPMSSMTDEEKVEYNDFNLVLVGYEGRGLECAELFDWLNAHHFDYRGLIEKELALPAKEEMYGLRKSI